MQRGGEAFVPRERVVGQLERQLMLATGCPALILYGRWRMGKSTLPGNLTGLLSPSVRIANLGYNAGCCLQLPGLPVRTPCSA